MAYCKDQLLEEADHLYDEDGSFVCPGCVSDPHLARIIASSVEQEPCTFCQAEPAAPISVLLDELQAVILAEYADPAEILSYCSEEGGYLGEVLDGDEVVRDHLDEWTDNVELLECA